VKTTDFQELVWEKACELYRDMPWRQDTRPYYVLVSEIMLQQTQVDRVIPKFEAFIAAFPDVYALAAAPLSAVLQLWSGLGYNRRAKFLHEAAKKIVAEFNGEFPATQVELVSLPGVGVNTAGALLAYSFNQPVIFIETNVRTVYFHHYFHDDTSVTDAQLREIVSETVDTEHPREWYWGIMDYGSYLKRQGVGRNDKSHHYRKQSALKGSVREVRGAILKVLAKNPHSVKSIKNETFQDERFELALQGLLRDGLVVQKGAKIYLAE
jgi:A/G-specific adenine glycosylase